MPQGTPHDTAAGEGSPPRRLYVYNGGFLTNRRLRRILSLSGYDIRLGLPGPGDMVGTWGKSPTARRGEAVAVRRGAPILRVEDAFLRSLHPGRTGEPPIGLFLDRQGVHFDPAQPSDIETLLATAPLDDTALLDRARGAIARLQEAHLSKYSAVDPALEPPAPGYVLVIDQTRGDASVRASGADAARFREMLVMAQEEHPGCPVVIKTHPETARGLRAGHFGPGDAGGRVTLCADPISPWRLFEGAVGVYTVSSQLGFEAIFAGHRPRVFGQPVYAGWGLTQDEAAHPRRTRRLSRAQLFAAVMILYPTWYDPWRNRLCTLEEAMEGMAARARAWREDRRGWTGHGMRLWKRRTLQKVFGRETRMIFGRTDPARPAMVWASKDGPPGAVRIEDGFLRSRGLGAELVPPLSLVLDDLGIYYDPARPSRLEHWIAARAQLRPDQQFRAERLIAALRGRGLSKYNLGGARFDLPPGRRILVPGQVEDDASIRTGTGAISTNAALLAATRAANPDAVLLYKPHPDVEAGLRTGTVGDAAQWADLVLERADMAALLDRVDEVWTMTSLTGFEALIRGRRVVTFGAPFYAGWGLTDDRGRVPLRRQARPMLEGLVHAALIDYPRYFDPLTGTPCPVEVALDRLATGAIPHPGAGNRLLAKLQGAFASRAALWR
ncbi:capsular polysaccharide export protein [Salinihabitans flavidus]|uniref:Capsular polysaccharide export protein n=1 Tax=Salinihabitans flavidus TaxID=569882 RepID=A0A1H8MTL8_9RHOB|nr:capsular polysaccharide export protein [Salinihabitans flavidus]